MSPPCGARIPERKADPKISLKLKDKNAHENENKYKNSKFEKVLSGLDGNDDVNGSSGSDGDNSEPIMSNNGVSGGGGGGSSNNGKGNGNGNGNGNINNGNNGNGNYGNGNSKQHHYPSLYPTRRPPSRNPTGSPTTAPTTLPIPIFTAIVTEHASDKNDPYLLATEPLVFPLNPRGMYVRSCDHHI